MPAARILIVFLMFFIFGLYHLLPAQQTQEDGPMLPESIDDVCTNYPERVKSLLGALDLERPGLEKVREAAGRDDLPAACQALIDYYRSVPSRAGIFYLGTRPAGERVRVADEIMNGIITCYDLSAKVPLRPGGGLDWAYNGPNNDREWGWALNRNYHLATLYEAWQDTGNSAYARHIDRQLCDWVLANPYPGKASNTPQWRGLEVYCRLTLWSNLFYSLLDKDQLSPATTLLVLSSIPEHADFQRRFHSGGGNWITMEMRGLATAAASWPEFKDSGDWLTYATELMTPELQKQVYPDGVQKELTSHYHWVALQNFDEFADLLSRAGRPVPEDFARTIDAMWTYIAYSLRPDGSNPLNNDSDRNDMRQTVLEKAKKFNRPDWAWIASNGTQGTQPAGPPSAAFRWAGQLIMRSGWDANAQWAFFDAGPAGTGHWHFDKLHLSVAAGGRDLLVDSGRFTYGGDATFRSYFVSSRGHNTIDIDGCGQVRGATDAKEPLSEADCQITPEGDFARGTYDAGYQGLEGTATHTRAVRYLRGKCWVVVDRIQTDRPRRVEAFWHYAPGCNVVKDGIAVASTDADKGNLRIVPVSDPGWEVNLVRGQTDPTIQGWWSREYNHKEPETAAVYSTRIEGPATFAWVLIPAANGPAPKATCRMTDNPDGSVHVTIDMEDGELLTADLELK